jgi:hypothetical protein
MFNGGTVANTAMLVLAQIAGVLVTIVLMMVFKPAKK